MPDQNESLPAMQPPTDESKPVTPRMPQDLQRRMNRTLVGNSVPALLIEAESHDPTPPMVVWLHGRTASKELDPGRYLRLMRRGISICALDLPGHGDRMDADLQRPERALDVILQMVEELDAAVSEAMSRLHTDPSRLGIGGMSAGGMVITSRCTRPHPYRCCVLEATTGSWLAQRSRPMFSSRSEEELRFLDPMHNLEAWTPIPVLAAHCRADQWVPWAGQERFLDAIEARAPHPGIVERLLYDRTGAPHEHVGFGIHSAHVKERELDFFAHNLLGGLS